MNANHENLMTSEMSATQKLAIMDRWIAVASTRDDWPAAAFRALQVERLELEIEVAAENAYLGVRG